MEFPPEISEVYSLSVARFWSGYSCSKVRGIAPNSTRLLNKPDAKNVLYVDSSQMGIANPEVK